MEFDFSDTQPARQVGRNKPGETLIVDIPWFVSSELMCMCLSTSGLQGPGHQVGNRKITFLMPTAVGMCIHKTHVSLVFDIDESKVVSEKYGLSNHVLTFGCCRLRSGKT